MPRPLARLLLALPLLLAGCGEDEPLVPTDRGAAASPLQPAVGTAVPGDAQPAQIVSVVVTGGEVSGDTGPVPVRLGSRVRLSVVSDVADTLLVEGYGLREVVAAERATQLELVADRAGTFAVLLADARTPLTTLDVR